MTPVQAVSAGMRAVNRTKRLWGVYWLWNVAFALIVVLPVSVVLMRDLGRSLYSERLFSSFELDYLVELVTQTRGWPLITLAPVGVLAAAGSVLASVYLAGGVLWIYRDPDPRYMPAVFFQGCGRHFGRLFWLVALSIPVYGMVLMLNGALGVLAQRVWGEGIEAQPLIIAARFRAAITLVLLLGVNMVFDYARIYMVAEDVRNPFHAALAAWRIVTRNLWRTSGAYGLVGLILGAGALAYGALSNALPRTAAGWLLLVFLLQQFYIVTRMWTRLLFYASQMRMYESLALTGALPEPSPTPPLPPEQAPFESAETGY